MSDYIKLFNTEQEQSDFLNSVNYVEPHISCTANGGNLEYNRIIPEYFETNNGYLIQTKFLGATAYGEPGQYFAWGEVSPKETYDWGNYKWGLDDNITKYNSTDGKMVLDPEDDAATVILGSPWRMLTYSEVLSLPIIREAESNKMYIADKNGIRFYFPLARLMSSTLYPGNVVTYARSVSKRGLADRFERAIPPTDLFILPVCKL